MFINLKSNAKIEVAKIYSLKFSDRKFVDEIFNKFYEQNRMKFNNQFILHNYSIFVI